MTNIILSGCCGNMGRVIAREINKREDCVVVAGVDIALHRDAEGILGGGDTLVDGIVDGLARELAGVKGGIVGLAGDTAHAEHVAVVVDLGVIQGGAGIFHGLGLAEGDLRGGFVFPVGGGAGGEGQATRKQAKGHQQGQDTQDLHLHVSVFLCLK